MKRAVAWELVTAFAFLGLVALHAEGESRRGWPTRWTHALLDPDRVSPWLRGLALQGVALRWILWVWHEPGSMSVRTRGRTLASSTLGVVASAVGAGPRCGRLAVLITLWGGVALTLLTVRRASDGPVAPLS